MLFKKIVLTGGPCAGKTTAISRIEQDLIEKGYRVFIVSESATELIKGGVRPFGDNSINLFDFQDLIINYQLSKESIYEKAANLLNCKCVLIYDRGVIDNKAYIGQDLFNELLKKNNLNELKLTDNYDMIIHLVTAALGAEKFYTLENNNARTETKEEAIELDRKTMNAWVGHRNLKIIENTTTFDEKLNRVIDEVHNLLGNPLTIRDQRKYVVSNYSFDLTTATKIDIEQSYIRKTNTNYEERLRKRTYNNESTYYLTINKKYEEGQSKVVIDKKLTEKEYLRLINNSDIESTISKTRYSFTYDNQYFRLDVFDDGLLLLEVDLTKDKKEVNIPNNIIIKEDVTNDKNYTNYELSKRNIKRLEKNNN